MTLVVGVFLKQWLERKPRLTYWLHSTTGITIEDPNDPAKNLHPNTHTVVLQNAGRKSATIVRLGHTNVGPVWYQIVPNVHYEQRDLAGGAYEIVIDNLTPGRLINTSYFYFGPTIYVDINTHFESDEGQAKFISVVTQRTIPSWVIWFRARLIIVGLATVTFLLWEFIPWIWGLMERAREIK